MTSFRLTGILIAVQILCSGAVPTYKFTFVSHPHAHAPDATALTGINNDGTISGYWSDRSDIFHDFTYSQGIFTDVTPSECLGDDSLSSAINDHGILSGDCDTETGHAAYVGTPGAFVFIHVKDYPTHGFGINNAGYSVGTYPYQGNTGGFVAYQGKLIKVLQGPVLYGINNKNAVVGQIGNKGYFSDGSYQFIYNVPGASATFFSGINDVGQIAGYAVFNEHPKTILLMRGNASVLEVPGAVYASAYAINNAGVIVGTFSSDFSGYTGFIATPLE